MIFRLALRNLLRRSKHSLTLILLHSPLVCLFFLGNSVLEQINIGLQRTYIENLTGDFVIGADSVGDFSLFGSNIPAIGEYLPVPILPSYQEIHSYLEGVDEVEDTTPLISGAAQFQIHTYNKNVFLFGIEGEDYQSFFPGLQVLMGSIPGRETPGVIITYQRYLKIAREVGRIIKLGEPILLTSAGDQGFKIREVPLLGIFRYRIGEEYMDEIILVDAHTLRRLNSVTYTGTREEQSRTLTESIDQLFSSDQPLESTEDNTLSPDAVQELLQHDSQNPEESTTEQWNYILVKLKRMSFQHTFIKNTETYIRENNLDLKIMNWQEAAGSGALIILLLRLFYNGGLILVLAAGVIAMVNIQIISLQERFEEIGTLRAMGTTKQFITGVILLENLLLSLISSMAAILFSYGLLRLLNGSKIPLGNELIRSLLGSSRLEVLFFPKLAGISIAGALLISSAAALYPLRQIGKIEPVSAMVRK